MMIEGMLFLGPFSFSFAQRTIVQHTGQRTTDAPHRFTEPSESKRWVPFLLLAASPTALTLNPSPTRGKYEV